MTSKLVSPPLSLRAPSAVLGWARALKWLEKESTVGNLSMGRKGEIWPLLLLKGEKLPVHSLIVSLTIFRNV